MKYDLTHDELQKHLEEQIYFMSTSIKLFDEGHHQEAKRIALALRILLHDSKNSKSLMKLLAYKDKIKYLDTASNYDPQNLVSHLGLTSININSTEESKTIKYVPKLMPEKPKYFNFRIWWEKIVIADKRPNFFRRKDLILSVANKDGGAHVDKTLKPEYADLSRLHSLGIGYQITDEGQIGFSMNFKKNDTSLDEGFIPIERVVETSIRQIGFEFLESIKPILEP